MEKAGMTEDRTIGGVEDVLELEEVEGEDGEEEQDSHQTTKTSDTGMTSIRMMGILVIDISRTGLQEDEGEVYLVTIRGLQIITILISEIDMDQLAMKATNNKYLRLFNSVILGKLRKFLALCLLSTSKATTNNVSILLLSTFI